MENLGLILSIVAFVTSLIAICGVIYAFAVWRGRVDKQLSDYSNARILDRMTKTETKMEVLWQAFTEQLLTNRPSLATRGSKFELTEDAKKAVGDVKALLPDINPGCEDVAGKVLIELPHRIGMGKLKHIAERHKITLGELLAIVSIELGLDL